MLLFVFWIGIERRFRGYGKGYEVKVNTFILIGSKENIYKFFRVGIFVCRCVVLLSFGLVFRGFGFVMSGV